MSEDVVILCGGLGTRLQSVVADRPKSLAPLHERPFLEWQLLSLQAMGFRNVVFCIGYMGEAIQEYVGNGAFKGLYIQYVKETEPRGTGGALRGALPFLRTDPVVVLNGDSWCHLDFEQLLHWSKTKQSKATIALTHVPDSARYGRVELNDHEEIVMFEEKGASSAPGWINAGMYVLSQEFILGISEQSPISLERDIFPKWVGSGLYGYPKGQEFFDIGTPDSYAQAEVIFPDVFQGISSMKQTVGD
jgi:NDP-sugar pyrophosphorylase family protein